MHYAVAWRAVKQAQFEKALRAVDLPGLTFVGGAHPVDRALYLIRKAYIFMPDSVAAKEMTRILVL